MKKTLKELAIEFDKLYTQNENAHGVIQRNSVRIGQILGDLRIRVLRETNMSFYEWTDLNLRRKDGSPYSRNSIKRYLQYGRNPEQAERDVARKTTANRRMLKDARAIVRHTSAAKLKEILQEPIRVFEKDTSISDQVNALVTLWEHSSTAVQKEFMQIVGLKEI